MRITLWVIGHSLLNYACAFSRIREDMPGISGNLLKSLLKTFRFILVTDANGGDILHLADEDKFDPTGNVAVTVILSAWFGPRP